ncbi:efflux RND transporter permease subunit [Marivita sp.]|uniref:efflux RND transporter permease subunit n=1 Tax=Marivita sp. TaxID=2003365 RepID=UPI003F6E7B74
MIPRQKRSSTFSDYLARVLVQNDFASFAAGLLILLFAGLGLQWLVFSTDNRDFFGTNNPELQAVEHLEDVYAQSDILLFAFVADHDLCTPSFLQDLSRFTDDAWLMPDVLRVESIANFNHSYSENDDIIVETLVPEGGNLTEEDAQRIRDIVLNTDELVNLLVSPNCHALGLFVDLIPKDLAALPRSEMAKVAQEMQAQWQASLPNVSVHLTGDLLGGVAINEAALRDLTSLIPLAFASVMLLMVLGFGTLSGWLGTVLVTLGGTVATLGFAGWLGIALIPATAISPLAVMVLITASCVHIVLGWTRRIANGDNRFEATQDTFAENLAAISVTNLTTAIGFLCLNFSESPPLAQMGTIVCLGILVGWVLTALFLPLILCRAPDRQFRPLRISPDAMARLARFALNQRGVLTTFVLLLVISIGGLTQLRFNDSALRYFDESFTFRTDSDAIEESLTGMETVQFSLQAGPGESVFAPEFLGRVERFTDWLHAQEGVVFVGSVTDVLKRLNQTLNGGDPDAYVLADSQEANAQAMMLYELSLPMGMNMNKVLDIDRTSTRLLAVLSGVDGQDVALFARDAEAWLRENEPKIATQAVGMGVAFSKLTQRNNQAMIYGMLTVMVLVSVLMIATLRDVKLGLISLVPNVLPAILGFGIWGWWVGDVNLGSTVVTTMTFGIVVDDTVHILMHYQRHRKTGMTRDEALELTFRTVGTALMVTSIAICSGFFIMTLSGFAINQHLGGLTACIIVLALMTDLILLPALLKRTNL